MHLALNGACSAGEFVPTARLVADHAIDALLAGPSAADAFVELLAELGRVKNDAAYQAWLVATLMRALAQPACVAKWRTCFEQHLQASSVLLARLRAAPPAAAAVRLCASPALEAGSTGLIVSSCCCKFGEWLAVHAARRDGALCSGAGPAAKVGRHHEAQGGAGARVGIGRFGNPLTSGCHLALLPVLRS